MGAYWWDSADGFRHEVTYTADPEKGFMPRHKKYKLDQAIEVDSVILTNDI